MEHVSAFEFHRGIKFHVVSAAAGSWQWAIHPPASVKEFKTASGQVSGTRHDAIEAAKREIERQDTGTI